MRDSTFINRLPRRLLLTLTLGLGLTAMPVSAQRAVLSGSTDGLRWTLYGPGQLGDLNASAVDTLRVSAPAGSTVVGSKYENGRAVLAFRPQGNTSLQDVYQYHDRQLTQQGFQRVSQSMNGNTATATYQRGNDRVNLNLTRDNQTYRATLDLMGMAGNTVNTATSGSMAQANTNQTNTNQVNLQNQSGVNPVVQATDQASVKYMLYGAGNNLSSLNNNPGMVSFSVPQGAVITNTNVNGNGDLSAQVTSSLTLQQMMDFYDKQFKQQGFTLVNPTDTGAGLDNALTYIYERPSSRSRISFSVEKEDNYRLVWDFQNYAAYNGGGAVDDTPLYGYDYNNVRYDFYGPNWGSNVTPNANRVGVGVPTDASQMQNPTLDNNAVKTVFHSNMSLREVFEFYDRQLTRQNFNQVSGQLTQSDQQIRARYTRNSGTVALTVQDQGNQRYAVTLDPASGQ